jgi:hypothetical protein
MVIGLDLVRVLSHFARRLTLARAPTSSGWRATCSASAFSVVDDDVQPFPRRRGRSPHPRLGHDTRALQAYLGHKNTQHTVRYTELSPARFRDFCNF